MITEKDIGNLYNTLSTAVMEGYDKDRLADLLMFKLGEMAKERGTDELSLLKEINKYLLKNVKVGRPYLTINNKWFSLIGYSSRYPINEIIHNVAHNIILWILNYYDMHEWVKSGGAEKVKAEADKALQWLHEHVDDFNRYAYLVSKVKWTKISTSYTYDAEPIPVCEINIGLSGLAMETFRHVYCEYVAVGEEIFIPNKAIKKKDALCIRIGLEDTCVIPWFVVAHEFAHCLANMRHGGRVGESGRRQVHDVYFIQAYKEVLRDMSKDQPLIKKYMRV